MDTRARERRYQATLCLETFLFIYATTFCILHSYAAFVAARELIPYLQSSSNDDDSPPLFFDAREDYVYKATLLVWFNAIATLLAGLYGLRAVYSVFNMGSRPTDLRGAGEFWPKRTSRLWLLVHSSVVVFVVAAGVVPAKYAVEFVAMMREQQRQDGGAGDGGIVKTCEYVLGVVLASICLAGSLGVGLVLWYVLVVRREGAGTQEEGVELQGVGPVPVLPHVVLPPPALLPIVRAPPTRNLDMMV